MKTKVKNYAYSVFAEFQQMGDVKGVHKGFVTVEGVARNTERKIFIHKDAVVFPYRQDPFMIKLIRDEEDPESFYVDAGKVIISPLYSDDNMEEWIPTLSEGVTLLTRANMYEGWSIIDLIVELAVSIKESNTKKFDKIYTEAKKREDELDDCGYYEVFGAYWNIFPFKQTEYFTKKTKKVLLAKMPGLFEKMNAASGGFDGHIQQIYETKDDDIIKKVQELLGREKPTMGFKK